MAYRQLKQNDATTIPFQIVDDSTPDNQPVDLTSKTAKIKLYFTGNSDGIDPGTVPSVDDVEVTTYVDRDEGRVEHDFTSDDFENSGRYLVEFSVDDGGTVQYYPKVGAITIEVDKRLGVISPGELGSGGSLSGDVDGANNDLTSLGTVEANVGSFGILKDRSSGAQVDIDSLISGFPSISESTSQVVSAATDLNFIASGDASVSVTDDGDSTVTVDVGATGGSGSGSVDITDGTTTVTDATEVTFSETGAAAVTVNDNNDGTGTVTVDATDTDTHTDVSDGGTTVVSDVSDINFGSNVSVSDDGDGSVTVSASGGTSGGDGVREITGTAAIEAGGLAEFPIFHKNGEKMELLRWAISLSDGGSDADVQLEYNPPPTGDAPTSTLVLDSPIKDVSGVPIDSHTAGATENAIARLTINHTNASGTDYLAGAGNGAIQYLFQYQRV